MTETLVEADGFQEGFIRIPVTALKDVRLHPTAKLIYFLVANESNARNDASPAITQEQLKRWTRVEDDRTIRKYLKSLKDAGLLSIERQQETSVDTDGRASFVTRTFFHVIPPEDVTWFRSL